VQLRRRQATAKTAAQRHIDDFYLAFTKDTRDLVKQLQRGLRDHLTATAEQLRLEIGESMQSAKRAVDLDAAEQQRRAVEARGQLEHLTALHGQITALLPGGVKLPRPRRSLSA
jgi:hypothetical protein